MFMLVLFNVYLLLKFIILFDLIVQSVIYLFIYWIVVIAN